MDRGAHEWRGRQVGTGKGGTAGGVGTLAGTLHPRDVQPPTCHKPMKTTDGTHAGARAGTGRTSHFAPGSHAVRDLVIIALLALVLFLVSAAFDLFNRIIEWVYTHDTWQLDELFTVALYLVAAGIVYGWRRNRELIAQIGRRERAEAERARLIPELENALADVSRLKTLLPICSSCRRVRDDRGYWTEVEEYVEIHFSTRFDDGLCPACARKLYSASDKKRT
jgi:hypothetical protein